MLVRLSRDHAQPLRQHPLDAPLRLPPNPLSRPELAGAVDEVGATRVWTTRFG
jgi:hypothetical protein